MAAFKLCMITDNNYSLYTGIALTSLKQNRNSDSNYKIYIICDSVSEENKGRLKELSSDDFEIVFRDVNSIDHLKDSLKKEHISATPTSIYKFMIPEILCDEEYVLYVDGDVLFYKDIAPLFEVDLKQQYAFVCPEQEAPEGEIPFSSKRLNINHRIYFQSGLMLLNLKQLREEKISEKLLDYRIHGINFLMDQDTFNVVFAENVGYYHPIVFPSYYELLGTNNQYLSRYGEKNKKQVLKKSLIVHLATKLKPWAKKMPYITRVYLKYHKKSPFHDVPLHPRGYSVQFRDWLYEKMYGSPIHKLIHKLRGKST